MMNAVKKWGPVGAAGMAGAAVADLVAGDRGLLIRLAIGVPAVALAIYGAHRLGLVQMG